MYSAVPCRQVYDKASPGYRGRCTAPLLLDKKTKRIISSESPEILATLFRLQLPGSTHFDLSPSHLDEDANQLKALVYNQASQICWLLLSNLHKNFDGVSRMSLWDRPECGCRTRPLR